MGCSSSKCQSQDVAIGHVYPASSADFRDEQRKSDDANGDATKASPRFNPDDTSGGKQQQPNRIPIMLIDIPEGKLDVEALWSRMTSTQRRQVDEFKEVLRSRGVGLPDDVTSLRAVRFAEGNVQKAVGVYCAHAQWYIDAGTAAVAQERLPPDMEAILEAGYFQYMAPGHCRRGCPIKVQATGRWAMSRMKACGVSQERFLRYHTAQMEVHRYLLTIDQKTVGSAFVRHPDNGQLLPVPLHPERGVVVICDIRGCSIGAFYDAMGTMSKMIDIDKPNYFDSMDRFLIINAPYALTHVAWPVIKPLLSKDVTDKVAIIDAERLIDYIDADNLPLEFQTGQPVKPFTWPQTGASVVSSATTQCRHHGPPNTAAAAAAAAAAEEKAASPPLSSSPASAPRREKENCLVWEVKSHARTGPSFSAP